MNYSEWNDLLAKIFFNPENAGKDIYLYLSKQDLINHARNKFNGIPDEDIWADFINAIKFTFHDKFGHRISYLPINVPIQLYNTWNKVETPPFIAFLILYILPLTVSYEEHFSSNNFYGKVNIFFRKYGITNASRKEVIKTGNFHAISHLWDELEEWSIIKKNCELGVFELKKFGNQKWKYVGKPFSQCVLHPKVINKLPELFYEAGLIPYSVYAKDEFRIILLKLGPSLLGLKANVLELIKKCDSNELGQSIIEIITREYKNWTGETHVQTDDNESSRIRRNYTVAPLFLQFKINTNQGLISFSYRIRSSNDFPEDLKFGSYENLSGINGWSRTLDIEFKESFELRDDFNKWLARFPEKDVRLFINAGFFQLSSDYWIEIDTLSRTDPMYLLCKNEKKEALIEWSKTFTKGNFKEEDADGLPNNYSLYKIINPSVSHPDLPKLTLYTEKKIELINGLKVNFRTYINDFLPEVNIINAEGNESIYLLYRNTENKIFLKKSASRSNIWHLPESTLLDVDFYIKIDSENSTFNDFAYSLVSSENSALNVSGTSLPKRDQFGNNTTAELNQYCQGSNIIKPGRNSQRFYSAWENLFISSNEEICDNITSTSFDNHSGNMLTSYLTLKNELTTEEFYKAFDFYYSKEFADKQYSENYNLSKIKKASLNYLDYIGILDYDYEMKKIVVNSPQLIFIPTNKGRKLLLIGGRDKSLITQIIAIAIKYNLQVEISKQFSSNEKLLLPDTITIKAFGKSCESYGEKNLKLFANELNIKFSHDNFPQLALLLFSAKIDEYVNGMNLTSEDDYNWARRVFDPEKLSFERNDSQYLDKNFSLIEYKLNEYTYSYKLWKDYKCYKVDKNWGKYIALKHYNKNIILYDNENSKLAIPWETPLPRLLSESVMLLSGLAPDFKTIEGRNYRIFANIPGIFTENLFHKLGQRPINKELK